MTGLLTSRNLGEPEQSFSLKDLKDLRKLTKGNPQSTRPDTMKYGREIQRLHQPTWRISHLTYLSHINIYIYLSWCRISFINRGEV